MKLLSQRQEETLSDFSKEEQTMNFHNTRVQ